MKSGVEGQAPKGASHSAVASRLSPAGIVRNHFWPGGAAPVG